MAIKSEGLPQSRTRNNEHESRSCFQADRLGEINGP